MAKQLNTKRLTDAKKEYEKLQKLIATYVKAPVVEDVVDPRIWFESTGRAAFRGTSENRQTK